MSDRIDLGPIPDWLVIDAVRYAVGRTSVQPAVTSAWLIGVWDKLTPFVQSIIRRDLDEEFRRDDFARQLVRDGKREAGCYPLGWDCDRYSWERVRELWAHLGAKDVI